MRSLLRKGISAIGLAAAIGGVSGCHSYHIDTTIENRTGAAVNLLEVDYPSASFGTDTIASGTDFHYRFQVQGNGAVKLQYTDASGRQIQITGPTVADRQEGRLEIVLLPGGRAEFHPQLTPHP
ncbi:MAG TPA: hypothetical protein VL991_02470 [Terracidiphilus sp.]|nr:hypothetical protein [Terracidiphilus sp.]